MSFKSVPKITEWVVCREKKTGNIVSVRKNLFKPIRHELYVPEASEPSYEAPSDMTLEEELATLTEERAWLSKDPVKKARYYELKNG